VVPVAFFEDQPELVRMFRDLQPETGPVSVFRLNTHPADRDPGRGARDIQVINSYSGR